MTTPPFIVFGPSKSGTTWLQNLLNNMPDIECQFQVPLFPFERHEYKRITAKKKIFKIDNVSPFGNVFVDSEAEESYHIMNSYLKNTNAFTSSTIKKYINKNQSSTRNNSVINTIGRMQSGLFADSKAELVGVKAYTNIENYLTVYPNGKCIFIIRDPRDVIVSKRFHSLRSGVRFVKDLKNPLLRFFFKYDTLRKVFEKLNIRMTKNFFYDAEELEKKSSVVNRNVIDAYGGDWDGVAGYLIDCVARYPDNCLLVKYENLKLSIESELVKILNFLDFNGSIEQNVEATILENDLVKFGGDSFFRKGTVGDWKNHFTDENEAYLQRKFHLNTGKLSY
jgi:hypothetical protein